MATALLSFVFAVAACRRSPRSSAALAASVMADLPVTPRYVMDPARASAWQLAKQGEEGDRIRLADEVGCTGLREGGGDPALRPTAIRAMAYCGDFSELGWLASMAVSGPKDDALAALDSAVALAANSRRAVDPEDADGLAAGCKVLSAVAQDSERSASERALAERALAMLAERGCAAPAGTSFRTDARDASQ
jgi:hypothetical protein